MPQLSKVYNKIELHREYRSTVDMSPWRMCWFHFHDGGIYEGIILKCIWWRKLCLAFNWHRTG